MYISQFILEYVISFAALIIVLVFVHELGHFLVARCCGVRVESFSIGFGPELWGYTDKKGTRWRISPIPLGGYVKMKGEMLNSATTPDDDEDSFHNKQLWQKALIVVAGPAFNLILPLIIFFLIPLCFGVKELKPQIKNVLPGSAAFNILQPGDIITEINHEKVTTFAELQAIVSGLANQQALITVKRNNDLLDFYIPIGETQRLDRTIGFIGIEQDNTAKMTRRYGVVESLKASLVNYKEVFYSIMHGLQLLFTGKVGADDLGGPIQIAQISGKIAHSGLDGWFFFLGALSINLALINLIPIPALDGGYLFMYIIQFIIRKPLPLKLQNTLVTVGFFILLTIMVLVSFNDIVRLLK